MAAPSRRSKSVTKGIPKKAPGPSRRPGAAGRAGARPGPEGESTMERILRVVAAMYRERGYDQCSLADMAKRVGFSAPAFYHYFRSKEEILAAFLEYTIADLILTVSARIKGETWSEKLASFMRAYVLWQLQQTPFPEAYERIFALGHLRNSLPPVLRRKILSSERKFYELCHQLVEGGI